MVIPADVYAMQDVSFWQTLAPDLTIGASAARSYPLHGPAMDMDFCPVADHLHSQGYFQLPPMFDARDLHNLRKTMDVLHDAGIPPVFIYIYDQPWLLFNSLSPLIAYFLGDRFALLPNFWAWNIPLIEGASGWPPHRDCQAQTRFADPDDSAGDVLMSLSLWVPLSDATLHNGCMSVLPRALSDQVPGVFTLPDEFLAQGIALPAAAGSVLGWSQDLYHWSNQVTAQATEPRMSLSLEFQNRAFTALAEPLMDISQPPPFANRLDLIARQVPRYQHMEALLFDVSALLDQCEDGDRNRSPSPVS